MNPYLSIDHFATLERKRVEMEMGGKQAMRRAKSAVVHLPDGRSSELQLGWLASNIPGGKHREILCPRCGRIARILRIVPGDDPILCRICVRKQFGAIYKSQQKSKTARSSDLDTGTMNGE